MRMVLKRFVPAQRDPEWFCRVLSQFSLKAEEMAQAGWLPCQLNKLLKRRESGRDLTFTDHVDQFDASQGRCS